MSNNVSHADNQQERLIIIGWILGFVDGEGCFSISFVKQNNKQEENRIRKGYKIGYQIAHEFAVTQGESSLSSLKILKRYFNVGAIYKNTRYDNHKENLYRYVVRKREDLIAVIIPFFQKYQLKTIKNKNFKLFVRGMEKVKKKKHLTTNGAIQVAKIVEKMNHKRNMTHIINILRNHTSDT